MSKPIHQVWTFRSDSNPDLEYQTLQYTDGATPGTGYSIGTGRISDPGG